MTKNIALVCLVAFSANLASAKISSSMGYLMEDCKYVSLNNSIRLAYQKLSPAKIALSNKSTDLENGHDVVVLQGFDKNENSLGLVGYDISLDDPENGSCYLEEGSEIKNLSENEIAQMKVAATVKEGERSESSLPGSKRYWNDCSTEAVNKALSVWSAAKPGLTPVIDYASGRKQDENGVRTYVVLMKESSNVVIPSTHFERPVRESKSDLGKKYDSSLMRVTMTSVKNGESCTFSSAVVD